MVMGTKASSGVMLPVKPPSTAKKIIKTIMTAFSPLSPRTFMALKMALLKMSVSI